MEEILEQQQKIQINENNPFIILLCYGTLLKGFSNYSYYLENRSEYLGTFKTEPIFTMFGRNWNFPIVTTYGDTAIHCDVFKIRSSAVLERIHALEGCSGIPNNPTDMYNIQEMETPYGKAYIYVQDKPYSIEEKIYSGNWRNRLLEPKNIEICNTTQE